MKIFERINIGLSAAILVICCAAFLLFGISTTGWKALSIPTGSMRPAIPPGSLALVHSVPATSLKVGDVITYINPQNSKQTISHRIIKTYLIGGTIPGFVTKGDANKVADPAIAAGSIEGKVMLHVPHVGSWLLLAKKPVVILPIVYIAALFIVIEEVRRLRDYYGLGPIYRAPDFMVDEAQPNTFSRKLALGSTLAAVFVMVSAAVGPKVLALLQSNTVSLTNNRISSGTIAPSCSGTTTNNNNITVNNSSSQTASSGNSSSSGNTNGGSANSGNASNSNSSSTTITVTNNC